MNVSELITSIKMDLGVYGMALPFEDEEKTFYDVIKLRTIKTFSQFYAHIMRVDLNLDDLVCRKTEYNESVYEIPMDLFGDRQLLYVRKVDRKNKLLGNSYLDPMLEDGMDLYQATMLGHASANLLSTAIPPFTFKFVQPNLLYLYNSSAMANTITIEFGVEHFDNLGSIPRTAWESFYELALIDIKRLLYNALKHHNEIQTAFGSINLRIDDWQNAESDRKELIERWRDVHHLDAEQFYII